MSKYRSSYMEMYRKAQGTGEAYDVSTGNKFEQAIYSYEKDLLAELYTEYFGDKAITLLDFACGTGRIISVFDELVADKVGMDTSAYQLEAARGKGIAARFIEGNLVTSPELLEDGSFDLITSFRLFLNLERANRLPILRQLRRVLKDDGYLIVDNHMNRYSVLGLMALFLRKVLRFPEKAKARPGQRGIIGTMSEMEFRSTLRAAGFRVIRVHRFWIIPGNKSLIALPQKALISVERLLARIPLLNLLSKNQVYVCQKDLRRDPA